MSDMSGVVVKLNDDEESEDEDTGGLLSRDYENSDEEYEDFEDISRHHKRGAGKSVLKRLRGDKKLPYPSLRSGTVMQLLNTLTICCIMFGMVIFCC